MAYMDSWNESTPLGSDQANTLDTIIQNVKRSLRERLEEVIPDWADDAVQPKRAVINVGVIDDRPAVVDSNAGEFYFSTDEQILYIFDGTSWLSIVDLLSPSTELPHRTIRYDDSQAVGSKQTGDQAIDRIIDIDVQATTGVSGTVIIDAGELTNVASWSYLKGIYATGLNPTDLMQVTIFSVTASTLILLCLDDTGSSINSTFVNFKLLCVIGTSLL